MAAFECCTRVSSFLPLGVPCWNVNGKMVLTWRPQHRGGTDSIRPLGDHQPGITSTVVILSMQKDGVFAEWRWMAHPNSYCCLAGRKQERGVSAAVKNNLHDSVSIRAPCSKKGARRLDIESTKGGPEHRGCAGVRCGLAHGASARAAQKLVSCSCASSVASKQASLSG